MLRIKQKIKEKKVLKIKEEIKNAQTLVVVSYKGLKVNDFQDFKKQLILLQDKSVKVKVFKNTLLKKAFLDSKFSSLNDFLTGMIFIIFSSQQNLEIIKEIKKLKQKFMKKVDFRIGFFEQEMRNQEQLQTLSNIPKYDQLLVNFVSTLKLVPFNLIWTLQEVLKMNEKIIEK